MSDNYFDNEEKPSWHSIVFGDDWCLVTLLIPVLFWFMWLIDIVWGNHEKPEIPIGMCAVASAILLPIAAYRFWRNRAVLIHGIETPYRIKKKGIGLRGMRDIEIEYHFDSKIYQKRISVSILQAEGQFQLFVNPKMPIHIAIRDIKH